MNLKKEKCILSDFDGTITTKDGLYEFFSKYASKDWLLIEKLWQEGKINSKECLQREFECINNLNEKLISEYIKTIEIDPYFKLFYEKISEKGTDIYILSDGTDYFINKILEINKISGIKVFSNHFTFKNGKFELTFPNSYDECENNAGTCKCSILNKMKKEYKTVVYIGDGASDFCVCKKADVLYAKTKLADFCRKNKIKHIEYKTFEDIIKNI